MGEASVPLTEPVSERIPTRALGVLPDERLAKLAAEGSPKAFTAIYERHHQALYRYCRSILGNDEDARDALQNTMVAAMRALPGEARKVVLKAWLFRVAHNEAISVLRRRKPEASIENAVEIPSEDADAETRDRLRSLFSDLKQLPDRQRGALVMRELNGLGYAEIAAALETSEAGAKQLVYESRSSLLELERGREMECESVRQAISARDGRVLRGRKLRAHLRSCSNCRSFRESISGRRVEFQALAPPLPAPAAAGILAAVLGGGGGGTGGGIAAALGGGAVGSTFVGSAAMKAGIVAVAAGIGVGGVGMVAGDENPFAGSVERSVADTAGQGGVRGTDIEGGGGEGSAAGADGGAGGVGGGGTGNGGGGAQGAATDHPGAGTGTNGGTGESTDGGADEAPGVTDEGPAGQGPGEGTGGGSDTSGGGDPGPTGGGDPPPEPPTGGGGGSPPPTPPTGGGSQGGGPIGTPPGQGGTPPGQGGVPPGLGVSPPGQGGVPPGQGGTPPGQSKPK